MKKVAYRTTKKVQCRVVSGSQRTNTGHKMHEIVVFIFNKYFDVQEISSQSTPSFLSTSQFHIKAPNKVGSYEKYKTQQTMGHLTCIETDYQITQNRNVKYSAISTGCGEFLNHNSLSFNAQINKRNKNKRGNKHIPLKQEITVNC